LPRGRVGFEGRFDYAAIGTVTNLASRLCGGARAGQILGKALAPCLPTRLAPGAEMTLSEFGASLAESLARGPYPSGIESEGDLEREFVIPLVRDLASKQTDILVCCHPWKKKERCSPECATEPSAASGRIVQCPSCWTWSKKWARVEAFGTQHNYDVAAKDRSRTLAVEAKLVSASGGRMPNGEVQRFFGQCALLATKHDMVIGLCGYQGELNEKYQRDTEEVKSWFEKRNVKIIFRKFD
jgi:hypothetical protein